MPDVRTLFKRSFGHAPPHVLKIPLSLELLGGYTEAHQGIVLSTAIDRFVEVAFVPRRDGRIDLVRDGAAQRRSFWPSDCEPGAIPGWLAPVAAVVNELRTHGRTIRGFNAAITVPGTDSSPVVLAAVLMIRQMFPFGLRESGLGPPPNKDKGGSLPKLTRQQCLRLAGLCADAERNFNLGDGLSQHFVASLINRTFETVQFDCLNKAVESHPLAGEFIPLLLHTGVKDRHHGMRRGQSDLLGRKAAKKLGVPSLRSVQVADLHNSKATLSKAEQNAVRFAVGECARAVSIESALRDGDILQAGNLLHQSHEEARSVAGITTPETDLLIDLAQNHAACIGARYTGNGSAGTAFCLVSWPASKEFAAQLSANYRNETGLELSCSQVKTTDGTMAGRSVLCRR
ncbi:MAG: hypothetical protein ACPGVU_08845 [Limisphaerales bacterium]